MSRLVTAFMIFMAALLGLTVVRSSNFRQGFLNQFGASTPTQTTGFSTQVPTDGSIPENPQAIPQRPPGGSGGSTSDLDTPQRRPNRRPRPVGAAW